TEPLRDGSDVPSVSEKMTAVSVAQVVETHFGEHVLLGAIIHLNLFVVLPADPQKSLTRDTWVDISAIGLGKHMFRMRPSWCHLSLDFLTVAVLLKHIHVLAV